MTDRPNPSPEAVALTPLETNLLATICGWRSAALGWGPWVGETGRALRDKGLVCERGFAFVPTDRGRRVAAFNASGLSTGLVRR